MLVQRTKLLVSLCLIFLATPPTISGQEVPESSSSQEVPGGSSDQAVAEGLTARINGAGLEFMKVETTRLINDSIREFEFPVFEGGYEGTLGSISYRIHNLNLSTFELGQTLLQTEAPNSVVIGVGSTDLALSGSLSASVSLGFLGTYSVSGDAVATVSGASLSQRIRFERTEEGLLKISAVECDATIGIFSLDVDNFDPAWVGSIIKAAAASESVVDDVTMLINQVICDTIEETINGGDDQEDILSAFNGQIPLPIENQNISMDAALSRSPVVTSNSIEMAAVGRCFPNDNPTFTLDVPFSFHPPLTPSSSMFQISLSDYVVNTFLASMAYGGALQISIPSQNVSAVIPFLVNAEFLTLLNPDVQGLIDENLVDNTTPLFLSFLPIIPPRVSIRPGQFSIFGSYNVEAEFITPTTVIKQDLLLRLDFNITVSLSASGNRLSWQIIDVDLDFPEPTNPLVLTLQALSDNIANTALSFVRGIQGANGGFVIPSSNGYELNIESLNLKESAIELVTDILVIDDDDESTDAVEGTEMP